MKKGKGVKQKIKRMLGKFAVWAFPERAKFVEDNIGDSEYGLFDRLIRRGLLYDASLNNYKKLYRYHECFWAGTEGTKFSRNYAGRFKDWFLQEHISLVIELEKHIQRNQNKYKILYELGSGNGQVVNYLSDRLNVISHFVGIDINEGVTNRNKRDYKKENLEFICANAIDWIIQKGLPGAIFFTNGGVLEYFSDSQISMLLMKISKELKPSAFAIIEPLASDYNLVSEKKSQPYGNECSFTHNYINLFKSLGFEIIYRQETQTGGHRWLLLLTKTR